MTAVSTNLLMKTQTMIADIFQQDLHKKRQLSLGYAALGLLASESLFIHEMGEGLVRTRGGNKKHATKQIDRMLSNEGFDNWTLSASWVPYVVGATSHIVVALDWTSFAADHHWTLSLNVLTGKGVSTPLIWKTVHEKHLKHNRARYEDQLLSRLKETLPAGVKVTLVADRGFADQKFFEFLSTTLQFNYIIRIKRNTVITHRSEQRKADAWLRSDGHAVTLKNAAITLKKYAVKQVIAVKETGMKAPWILVTNTDMKTREVINLYAKRWKIEPYFRDMKDGRFGLGLRQTHIKAADRRDRLLLVLALSYLLLLLLGEAGEQIGFDRKLKVNTVKTRTHSLFRQGQFYYEFFSRFSLEEQQQLMHTFHGLLTQQPFWCDFFGLQK